MLLIYDHVRFPAVQQAQRGSAVIPLFRRPRDFTGVLSGDNNWKVESLNWFICSIDFWWVFVLFFFSLFLSFFLFVNIGSGKWNNVISRDMIYYISINIVWLIRVFDNPCNFLILGKFLLLLLKLKFNKECCCIISNLQVIEFNFSQKFRNETCLTNLVEISEQAYLLGKVLLLICLSICNMREKRKLEYCCFTNMANFFSGYGLAIQAK